MPFLPNQQSLDQKFERPRSKEEVAEHLSSSSTLSTCLCPHPTDLQKKGLGQGAFVISDDASRFHIEVEWVPWISLMILMNLRIVPSSGCIPGMHRMYFDSVQFIGIVPIPKPRMSPFGFHWWSLWISESLPSRYSIWMGALWGRSHMRSTYYDSIQNRYCTTIILALEMSHPLFLFFFFCIKQF